MCRIKFTFVLVILVSTTNVKSMEQMYMKRSHMDDSQSAASGFSYQVQNGAPLSYTSYSKSYDSEAAPSSYSSSYGPGSHSSYSTYESPSSYSSYSKPIASYSSYSQNFGDSVPYASYNSHFLGFPPLSYGHYAHTEPYYYYPTGYHYYPKYNYPIKTISSYAAPIGETVKSDFEKEGGEKFSAAKEAEKGEKGESGYKNEEGFEKAGQGKHEDQAQKGFYEQAGGNKAAKHEEAGKYDKKEQSGHAAQGENYHRKKSHKKGSKTTGYHKVHHKDEYKKDHTFYDESDNSGHFNKYGDYNNQQSGEAGGFKKGGSVDSAFKQDQFANKGHSDKAVYDDQDKAYKDEHAGNAFFSQGSEFAKKGKHDEGKVHGYAEKDKAGFLY